MKYKFKIIETLSKSVEIEAASEDEAFDIVCKQYDAEEITLDRVEDFEESEICPADCDCKAGVEMLTKNYIRVKKVLILLFLLLPMMANAYSFSDGTFAYNINNDKQTVTVVANTNAYSGDLVIPATVTNEGQTYQVTEVGASAFKNCTRLYSIQFPEGLKIIGNNAFVGCTGLESVKLPNSLEQINYAAFKGCRLLERVDLGTGIKAIYGNYDGSTGSGAFEDCTSLVTISIPASVTEINASVFRGCTALESVTFHDGVEHIGSHCFQNCSSLTSIVIPSSVTNIGENTFVGCRSLERAVLGSGLAKLGDEMFSGCQALEHVTINNGCAYIPAKTFQNCTGLTEISIPRSVESIGYAAFKGCRSMERVTLEQGLVSIYGNYDGSTGSGAFEDCISLESIVIPNSVTEMNASTFRGCTGLKSITLSKSLLHIGSHCFQNCKSLTSIVIPNNASSLGAHMFSGCTSLQTAVLGKGITKMGESLFKGCSALKEVIIEKGCGIIAAMTFENCTSLTSISIPGSVESVGYSSFKGCTSLSSVHIEKGLTALYGNYNGSTGSGAFENCTALEEVVLPSSLTTINASVFRNCSSLKRFTIQATVLPEVGTNVFQNAPISSATLYVPEKSIEKYRSTEPWSQFGAVEVIGTTPSEEKDVWYMITNDSREIPMQQVNMIVAADDDATFAVLDADGNILADLVKRARFVQKSATSIDIPMANEQNMLKSLVNNRLTLIGAKQDIYMYNVSGVQVQHAYPMGVETTVDVSRLVTGIYILKCGQQSFKFKKM